MCEARHCAHEGRWSGFCYLHDKVHRGLITGYYDGAGTFQRLRLHAPPRTIATELRRVGVRF